MLTWSYVFVLPVCTCLDYMKNPLLLLLPHEDLHEYPISSQNAVKMKCWPDLIYYFRYALPECHFTTSRQLLVLLVYMCWLHEEPLNFPDYMKTSVIIQLQAGSWWRWHDDPTMPATFLCFTVIWTYLDYLSPAPYWHEPISPHEDSSQHPTTMKLTS